MLGRVDRVGVAAGHGDVHPHGDAADGRRRVAERAVLGFLDDLLGVSFSDAQVSQDCDCLVAG